MQGSLHPFPRTCYQESPGSIPREALGAPLPPVQCGGLSVGSRGSWSSCASPELMPSASSSLTFPAQDVPKATWPSAIAVCMQHLLCRCCVLFTLKPNDGASSRGLVISLPLRASSIRDRAALEPRPCSVLVTRVALGGLCSTHWVRKLKSGLLGSVSLLSACQQDRAGQSGGFPGQPAWLCPACASSCAVTPPLGPPWRHHGGGRN